MGEPAVKGRTRMATLIDEAPSEAMVLEIWPKSIVENAHLDAIRRHEEVKEDRSAAVARLCCQGNAEVLVYACRCSELLIL